MKNALRKILIIEENDFFRKNLSFHLESYGFKVFQVNNITAGLKEILNDDTDLIINGLTNSNLETIKYIRELKENIPVIVLSENNSNVSTIKAIQMGAYDYVEKSQSIEKYIEIINNALKSKSLSEKLQPVILKEESTETEYTLIGKDKSIKEIIKNIGILSLNRVSVLIQGETGSGKEVVARLIHNWGITRNHPFIAINCTSFAETLLESELFGYVRGAFTDAFHDKKGKFELAGEGTIFLDEISEISPNLQIKLLRVLQEKSFEKVGGENTISVNARIIAATNKSLKNLIRLGKFREDLYYRLNVVNLNIPPLRDRKDDIPLLVFHFLKKINKEFKKNVIKIPFETMEILQSYFWKGNVRELENVLLQAVINSKGDVLEKESIIISHPPKSQVSDFYSRNLSLEDLGKEHIKFVLDSCRGDKKAACEILQISPPTLRMKILEN